MLAQGVLKVEGALNFFIFLILDATQPLALTFVKVELQKIACLLISLHLRFCSVKVLCNNFRHVV